MADTALGPVLCTVQFDAVDGKKNAEGWSSMFSMRVPREMADTALGPMLPYGSVRCGRR